MLAARHGRLISVSLALSIALLLTVIAPAVAESPREERVKEQQKDNQEWQKEAEGLQNDYYKRAEDYYKAKKYSSAARYYKRALSITYKQWDLREVTRVAIVKGDDRTVIVPAKGKVIKKIDTTLNQKIELRLDSIGKARITDLAEAIYEEGKELYDEKSYQESYRQLIRIGGDRLPRDLQKRWGTRADKLIESIEKDAIEQLEAAKKAIQDGETQKVIEVFSAFRKHYGDMSESEKVSALYQEITASEALQKLLRNEEATAKLAEAEKLLAEEDLVAAYDVLKENAPLYTDTEPGEKMTKMLAEFHADKARMRAVSNQRAAEVCDGLMRKANNFRKNRLNKRAAWEYRKIIERYPDTDFADEAKEALEEMGMKP